MVHIDNAKINLCIHFIVTNLVTDYRSVYIKQMYWKLFHISNKVIYQVKKWFLTHILTLDTYYSFKKRDLASGM